MWVMKPGRECPRLDQPPGRLVQLRHGGTVAAAPVAVHRSWGQRPDRQSRRERVTNDMPDPAGHEVRDSSPMCGRPVRPAGSGGPGHAGRPGPPAHHQVQQTEVAGGGEQDLRSRGDPQPGPLLAADVSGMPADQQPGPPRPRVGVGDPSEHRQIQRQRRHPPAAKDSTGQMAERARSWERELPTTQVIGPQ